MDKQQNVPLINQVRGSSALAGWADSILCIGVHEGVQDSKYIEFTLRDTDIRPERNLKYNYETRGFDWSDPKQELAEMIAPVFQTAPGQAMEMTTLVLEVQKKLHLTGAAGYKKACEKVVDLVKAGLIVRGDTGILTYAGAPGSQPGSTPPTSRANV